MNALLKAAVALFAFALIVAGAVLTLSPIPGGILILAVGLILFASVMPSAVRWLRRRWRFFDRLMHRLEKILPEWVARRLRASDYDHEQDDVENKNSRPARTRADRRRRR